MSRLLKLVPVIAAILVLIPAAASAQEGSIAGTVRDASDAVIPGVTVEVTSPALIEKVRSTVTDDNGQYRITALPVGTYSVTFSLQGFNTHRREDIVLTTGFTAPVNAVMAVGQINETVVVQGITPTVDVQTARQVTTFSGDEIRDLPTARNPTSLLVLVPGITTTGFGMGICSGGAGVFCSPHIQNFNAHSSMLDTDGLQQGRLLVDGMVINTASAGQVTGVIGGYVADIANAQEINIQLSGALGESETGGTSFNIIPRTGGNRFAGNYTTSYTRQAWFDRNSGTHPGAQPNIILHDHDVSGAFGGPVKRDRLWFHSVVRTQGKESSQNGGPFFYNLNAGKWGDNYQPDRARGPVTYTNQWKNANTRLTWQATQRNKFNIFWDEQDSCQDPCNGSVSAWTSPESWFSVQQYPNSLSQVIWTNPFTNKLLFEAGLSRTAQHYDFSRHRYELNPQSIPRVAEFGNRAGGDWSDPLGLPVTSSASQFGLTSGSISGGRIDNVDNYRARASASYVTGAHNAKIGYEGQFYSQIQHNFANGPRLSYRYDTPAVDCYNAANPAASTCGNASLHYPNDPYNQARRPRPTRFTMNTGPRSFNEDVRTHSFYAQDQWTVNRFTLNGALRYDNAQSQYNPTCVGPDTFVPVGYCTPAGDGVSFHNITPRWSVAWDVFGDGKTAIKWNMGKYLGAAGFSGVYTGANPARRTVNTYERLWNDLNGNRIPDCDYLNFVAHTHLGDDCGAGFGTADSVRFGRDPFGLDASGLAIGLQTTQCGRTEVGIPQAVQDYCARSGQNLLSGWNRRRSEWQFGLGIQREILPRLSAEVTYNQRWYQNQTVTDTLGTGCDLYAGSTEECLAGNLEYRNPQYSFYSVRAPVDPLLPNGGGYWIHGNNNRSTSATLPNLGDAITLQPYVYGWRGVDTNFIYRARGGLRLNGGTSTGKSFRDTCSVEVDAPSVRQREGGRGPACTPWRPWQTNVRGSVSYTIPWIDVLASAIFQSRPGDERSANYQFPHSAIVWAEGSQWRATNTAGCPAATPVGCLYGAGGVQTPTINLLDISDLWGERITLADLKLAKNIRFSGKRLNVGVDIYNVFNSDAIVAHNDTYNPEATGGNPWGTPTTLVAPRFARLTVQFDF